MNEIETTMCNSSAVWSAEYDIRTSELIVYYHNDSVYKYKDVPKFIWRGLFEAESKGKFLNKNIFKKFTYYRVN